MAPGSACWPIHASSDSPSGAKPSYRLSGPQEGFDAATVTVETTARRQIRAPVRHRPHRPQRPDRIRARLYPPLPPALAARQRQRGHAGRDPRASRSASASGATPSTAAGGCRTKSSPSAGRRRCRCSSTRTATDAAPGRGGARGGRGHRRAVRRVRPDQRRGHTFVAGLQPYTRVLVSIDESTLPDPFLMPRGKGLVVTPRPGVAAVLELAVSPTGEVKARSSCRGQAAPGRRARAGRADGAVAARAMSEFDGFFLFERVPYGRYRLKLSSSSEQVLGRAASSPRRSSSAPSTR